MGICLKEVDICQNAENVSPRRAEENQCRNTVNQENNLQVRFVVSRKIEIKSSGQPMLTVESKSSL